MYLVQSFMVMDSSFATNFQRIGWFCLIQVNIMFHSSSSESSCMRAAVDRAVLRTLSTLMSKLLYSCSVRCLL